MKMINWWFLNSLVYSKPLMLTVNLAKTSFASDRFCKCYQEIHEQTDFTACRLQLKACKTLSQKVKIESKVLVSGSETADSQAVKGICPAGTLGKSKLWLPSKKKGAFWTPYA